MIGLVRAAALCATLALGLALARLGRGRGQGLQARRSRRCRDQAGGADQERGGAGRQEQRATLRTDADAAFKRNDFRSGLQILGQIAATSPEDSRQLAQARPHHLPDQAVQYRANRPSCWSAPRPRPTSPISAPATQARRRMRSAVLGRALSERKLWRPALDSLRLSLDLREVADVRGQYEKLRDEHGFRLLDYTVDSDSASPRACFQFSEELAKRTDFAPFLALAGTDKPALSAEDKQLCVDGLKHGERYNINLRAGLPSTVKEGLPKSAEFNIYVRDRKPFVRFTGPRLCAAAHRPARHSAGQRQYAGGHRQRVPDRRPQPDQHGDRQRLPEAAQQLPAVRSRRPARRQGLVGRARHRDHAEPGRHHRIPGRSGARRPAARRLCDDRGAKEPRQQRRRQPARDAVVHRLRSRRLGVLRQ